MQKTENFVAKYRKLKNLQISIPTMEQQIKISRTINKAYKIRQKREESLRLTDDFIHSLFLHMFDDAEEEFSILSMGDEIKSDIIKRG